MRSRAIPLAPVALGLAAVVLLLGLWLHFVVRRKEYTGPLPDLAAALANPPLGWTFREEPLGATEALTEETRRLLQLDGYVHRTYRRGSVSFSVYLAYWRELRQAMPIVVDHLPDHCWVSSGMSCLEFKNRSLLGNAEAFPPAEWRLFSSPSGQRFHVAYWLWVGGDRFVFGDGLIGVYDARRGFHHANLVVQGRWWLDLALKGSRQQLFVRCSANVPFAELFRDRELEAFLRRVLAGGERITATALQ